ncbi:peroxiredoxin, partial [Arthrospira platensis SPKY2]
LGMDVGKNGLGFGRRSWRYSMLVDDGNIEVLFSEDTQSDEADPYKVSKATVMMDHLKGVEL